MMSSLGTSFDWNITGYHYILTIFTLLCQQHLTLQQCKFVRWEQHCYL